jgi:vaccinia related kinase
MAIFQLTLFDHFTGTKMSKEDYVIKVEPHTNGPLFVELNFYCRATKKQDIEAFVEANNLAHLGIPGLKGSGSFVFRNKRLRFIVLPRYGTDLQTILDKSKSHLSVETASSIATQVVNTKSQSFSDVRVRGRL